MNKYKICRWDPIVMGNSVIPVPVIYIKPDKELLAFSQKNHDALLVEVSGTNTIYDGKKIAGILSKSRDVPVCNTRPNYFNQTGTYVIVLNAEWYGYPSPRTLGSIVVSGLKGTSDDKKIDVKETDMFSPYKGDSGMDLGQILGSLAIIAGIFLVLFIVMKQHK